MQGLLERDPDPDAWVRALDGASRRARRRATRRPCGRRSMVDRKVPISSVGLVGHGVLAARARSSCSPPTLERYLDARAAPARGRDDPGDGLRGPAVPAFGVDDGWLDQVLAVAEGAAPVVRQTVVERVDEVRRMLASRSAG